MRNNENNFSLCTMNSHGVRLLNQGQFVPAARCFEMGMQHIRTFLSNNHGSTFDPTSMHTSKDVTVHSGGALHVELSEYVHTDIPSNYEGVFSFFGRAMVMRCDCHHGDEHSLESLNRATAAFLYNMALTKHLIGMQGEVYERSLLLAKKLYRMSIRILQQLVESTPNDVVIQLACINNLGQIHCYFVDTADAMECLSSIKHVLDQHAMHLGNDPSRISSDLIEFSLTTMLDVKEQSARAA